MAGNSPLAPVDYIEPGDCLLYSGRGPFSWLIKGKTFSRVSHVEVALGSGRAVSSRDGIGVDNFPLRLDGLVEILKPTEPFDLTAALQWYGQQRGKPYDWRQLFTGFGFFMAGRKTLEDETAFFCSEFCAAFYRHGGLHAFAAHYPTSVVTPGMFRSSPHFRIVWSAL